MAKHADLVENSNVCEKSAVLRMVVVPVLRTKTETIIHTNETVEVVEVCSRVVEQTKARTNVTIVETFERVVLTAGLRL